MVRSTPRNREKRIEFLETARILLQRKDPETIRMEDVAAAAGRTRKTLYAHFLGRDDLLIQLFIQALEQRWKRQLRAMAKEESGLAKIRSWGESFMDFAKSKPRYLRLQAYLDFHGIDPLRITPRAFDEFDRLNRKVVTLLREAYRLGLQDGSLRQDLDVECGIAGYVYGLRCVLNRALFSQYTLIEFDPDRLCRQFIDTFMRGIARQQGGY